MTELNSKSVVIYDGECTLCTTLAQFVLRQTPDLEFASFVDFAAQNPELGIGAEEKKALGFFSEGVYVSGAEAWTLLVEQHPDLRGLNWMAQKIGMTSETVGRSLEVLGHAARRLCLRCRR